MCQLSVLAFERSSGGKRRDGRRQGARGRPARPTVAASVPEVDRRRPVVASAPTALQTRHGVRSSRARLLGRRRPAVRRVARTLRSIDVLTGWRRRRRRRRSGSSIDASGTLASPTSMSAREGAIFPSQRAREVVHRSTSQRCTLFAHSRQMFFRSAARAHPWRSGFFSSDKTRAHHTRRARARNLLTQACMGCSSSKTAVTPAKARVDREATTLTPPAACVGLSV